MWFAKRKLRVSTHLIPRPLLLPRAQKRCYDRLGFRSEHCTNGFAVFFVSSRLCVSHAHKIRLDLHAWLPFSRGREQGAGGMRVGRALAYVQSCLLLVNHHPGWEDSFRTLARTCTQRNGTRTRKNLTSISYDLSVIVAMDIAVGSSTSTASRSTSTASLSTTRTARRNPSSDSSLFVPYVVRKTQTASVHPPHPPTSSPPPCAEEVLRQVGVPLRALHKRVRGFLCVFSSLREPCAQDTA